MSNGRNLSYRRSSSSHLVLLSGLALGLILGLVALANPGSEDEATPSPPLFTDAFETGDTSAWSLTTPAVLARFVSPDDDEATNDSTPTLELVFVSVDGTGIDPSSLQVSLDDGPARAATDLDCTTDAQGATCRPVADLPDGPWTARATIGDLAGRTSPMTTRDLVVDTGVPAIILDSPVDGLLTNDPGVRFQGSVDEAVDLFLDGDPVALGGDLTFDHLVTLVEGAQTRRLTALDAAGNVDEVQRSLTLDTAAPDAVVLAGVQVVEGDAGTLDVTGDAGAAEAGSRVTVTNLRTGTSVEIVAGADGSFAASLDGVAGDQLRFDIVDAAGNAGEAIEIPSPFDVPPAPEDVATPVDPTVPTGFDDLLEFLWTGEDPIQRDVDLDALDRRRLSLVQGRVLDRDLEPVPGVVVEVLDQPEMGSTRTRADGAFDLAVHGGGPVVLDFERADFLPVQRETVARWGESVRLDDVLLTRLDPVVTTITSGSTDAQVARGSEQSDADGARTATLVFAPGTSAEMVFADGARSPLPLMDVRATEYTVGPEGERAMPASLPPTVGYTYAVELSVDEALAAGAERVEFDQPVSLYVENFLGFPVGGPVPLGYYDRREGRWIGALNGRVVEVLEVVDGLAALDVDGSGTAADEAMLADLGVTEEERRRLAEIYPPGTSLWRSPIPHFTPWDCNWPYGPPDDAEAPPSLGSDGAVDAYDPEDPTDEEKDDAEKEPDPCEEDGSVLECENQVVRKYLPIVGTPYRLAYSSDRAEAHDVSYYARVPVTGPHIPESVQQILVDVEGFGVQSVAPSPYLSLDLNFPKTTSEGLRPQGKRSRKVRRAYVFPLEYKRPAEFESSWGRLPEGEYDVAKSRQATIILWGEEDDSIMPRIGRRIGVWDARRAYGMGGWSLDVHHVFDPSERTLYLGDGRERSARGLDPVLTLAIGAGGASGSIDDGVVPLAANLTPTDLAVDAEGRIYVNDRSYARIRRVGANGLMETVAGTGEPCGEGGGGAGRSTNPCGEGIPATQAQLGDPSGMGLARGGSLIFADRALDCVRRVDPDGIITTVAGVCQPSAGGGGGGGRLVDEGGRASTKATDVLLDEPFDVAVLSDGSFYVSEYFGGRIRYVGTNGKISTVTTLPLPSHLALGRLGALFVSSQDRIYRIDAAGRRHLVAGDGTKGLADEGDVAKESPLDGPAGLLPMPDGGLYFAEVGNGRIRWISPNGKIHTLAGEGDPLVPQIGGPARTGTLPFPNDLVVLPEGGMAIVDVIDRRVWKIGQPMEPPSEGEIRIPSEDGGALYVFDPDGRHLRTIDTSTNALLFSFTYDETGLLAAVEDVDGAVTTFHRHADGLLDRIESPYGQVTEVEIDGEGDLVAFTNPADESRVFTYDFGLLRTDTDPLQHTKEYFYRDGRLAAVEDENDARTTFYRTAEPLTRHDNFRVTKRNPSGQFQQYFLRHESDGSTLRTVREGPANGGLETDFTVTLSGSSTVASPDETTVVSQPHPDPRFGMAAPYPGSMRIAYPSGRSFEMSSTRSVVLDDPEDPLSLRESSAAWTVAGETFTTHYDAISRTTTSTTAEGRTSTVVLDAKGRWTSSQMPGRAPLSATYHPTGEIDTVTEGTGEDARVTTYTYDTLRRVESITDPADKTVTFGRDDANRVTSITLADGQVVGFGLDDEGKLETLTPPGRPAHRFTYTPTDLPKTHVLPDVGEGESVERWTWDDDQRLDLFETADGETIDLVYDPGFPRLARLVSPRGTTSFTYGLETGQLESIADPDGGGLAFGYDGSLLETVTWSGEVAGSVTRDYDSNLRLGSLSVNGASPIALGYDADSLLTSAGALVIQREPATGRLDTVALGDMVTSWTYTPFGEPETVTVTRGGSTLYAESYVYDPRGWVEELTRTQGGSTTTTVYGFDDRGRLETVTVDGVPRASYGYDANSNRTSYDGPFGPVTGAVHDGRDRLVEYGGTTYTYTAAGELATKSANGQTVTLDYDVFGNLRRVDQPSGTTIEYVIDASQRRIGRKVDGTLTHGWLYQDGLNPVAELNAAGEVVSRFVYATRPNVPDYMIRSNKTYRIVSDHLGSPRLVVDVATGAVAQELRYDEFGRITLDTNPGFQPFGFAGGLYDPATGLVRFGARDYDPEIGRWTTPDPIGFAGGTNLYSYARQNPVAFVDADGQIPLLVLAWVAAETGMAIWDVIDAWNTLGDPCSDWLDKLLAVGGAAGGVFAPGGGYGMGAKAGRRGIGDGGLFLPDEYYRGLQRRAPGQSAPLAQHRKYDADGNLKQVTVYDEFGDRVRQYDLGDEARHGEGYHTFSYSPENPRQSPGGGVRSGHLGFD